MSKKKEKIDLNNLAPEEELKYEIAKELGLLDDTQEAGRKEVRYVTADKICFRCHDKRKETI